MKDKEKIKAEAERLYKENTERASIEGISAATQLKKVINYIDNLTEEPVSEDLEEAWIQAYENEKDEILVAYDHHAGFVSGSNWKEEQMMKNSFDATVYNVGGTYLKEIDQDSIVKALEPFKNLEKVKVLIVKETEK